MESVIMEIRAGVGGEEAALFVRDLFRMYLKYAQSQNWKQRIFHSKESNLGGLKEIIFELEGENTLSKMKNEAGVHRVQRIPETEKSGRIHTSTVSVAILRKPKREEVNIRPGDLKFDFYKASGHGGQYINKRMTAVRATHLPTGIVVTCQTERSLQQNKESAVSILAAKLLEKKETKKFEKLGRGFAKIKKEREVKSGLIESYIHSGKKIGAMVELHCESDFVAKSEDFQKLAHELCLQIVAIPPEEIPLLKQPYIRDEAKTVRDLIDEYISKFGENIIIKRFARFEI